MKSSCLLILLFFISCFFTGCSISNKLSQYPSEEQFYKDFNNDLEDREVTVTFKSGSSVFTEHGVKAAGDTLSIIQKNILLNKVTIPIKLVGSIKYNEYNADNVSGFISTNNGNIYEAENITSFPDSIRFMDIHRYDTFEKFNTGDIQKVTYTKNWVTAPAGFIIGLLAGIAVGLTGPIPEYEGPHGSISSTPGPGKSKYVGTSIIYCSLAGCVIGSIVGYLIGFDYDYYFE